MTYGALPLDCGLVDIDPVEMLYWMYCPISLPGGAVWLPDNLKQFMPILSAACHQEPERFRGEYVYLTAKRIWVGGNFIGNRPGWHSDGFGTDDLNFIWFDRASTEFIQSDFELPPDCENAMAIMGDIANRLPVCVYPSRHLLRLDQFVIHRSPVGFEPGMRTFVKVSISKDRYNLEGNSVNHLLPASWPMVPRQAERNHQHA